MVKDFTDTGQSGPQMGSQLRGRPSHRAPRLHTRHLLLASGTTSGNVCLGTRAGLGRAGGTGTACAEGTSNSDRRSVSDRQPKPHDPPHAGTTGQQLTEPCLSRSLTTADTFPSHPCSPQQLHDSQTPTALCLLLQQHLGTVPLTWQTCSTVPSCTATPPDLQSQGSSTCYTNCKHRAADVFKHDLQHDLHFTSAK